VCCIGEWIVWHDKTLNQFFPGSISLQTVSVELGKIHSKCWSIIYNACEVFLMVCQMMPIWYLYIHKKSTLFSCVITKWHCHKRHTVVSLQTPCYLLSSNINVLSTDVLKSWLGGWVGAYCWNGRLHKNDMCRCGVVANMWDIDCCFPESITMKQHKKNIKV